MIYDSIFKIGFAFLILGACMADSQDLRLPFALIVVGATLLLFVEKEGDRYDE